MDHEPAPDRAAPSVRPVAWHRRLEARVLACVSLIAGLSIGAVVLATRQVVTTHVLQNAEGDLEATREAFAQLVDGRAANASSQLRLVTALPVFRAHLADARLAEDRATIEAMAETYRRDLQADFCVVTDPRGGWLGRPGWPDRAPPASLDHAVREALADRSFRSISVVAGQLFLVVSEPCRYGDEIIGTFTAGYAQADAVANDLARATRSQVTFVVEGRVVGSSLDAEQRREIGRVLALGDPGLGQPSPGPAVLGIGNERWIGGLYPMPAGHGGTPAGRLILLRPWQPTQELLEAVLEALLLVGSGAFLLIVWVTLVSSRRITRPLQEIAAASVAIAAGAWSKELPVGGGAEAASMATALNEMTASLRHWYEEARARSDRLEAAYRRFEAVARSANDAIISADETGAIVFWNRRAETMFGWTESDAKGMRLDLLVASAERATLRRRLEEMGSPAAGPAAGRTSDMRGRRSDGREFPVEISFAAWRDGQAIFVTAIFRDVTERKQAEETAEQLRQAQKMEAIGRLAGGVAHDFNNILMIISTYSELSLLKPLEPDLRSAIEEIQAAGDRAAALTRQLLAFSRKQILAPRVVRLDEIVAGMEKMVRRLIGEDVVVRTASDAELGRVKADPGQLEQVILNLLINARDAMPRGGCLLLETRNVELDERRAAALGGARAGSFVTVSVTDSGCGMGPDVLARVFEPFFTTKDVGKGTGLGLATVHGIVQQSGGFIEVESEVGRGSTFHVYLPRIAGAEEDEDEDKDKDEHASGADGGKRSGHETVLVVEDEPRVRALLSAVLRENGYVVLEASGGEEALAGAERHAGAIDLLVTDVVMPGMSGRAIAERLTARRPGLRVLFVSGYTDDAVIAHGIHEGMPFLQKPFTAERLLGKVRELLATKAACV